MDTQRLERHVRYLAAYATVLTVFLLLGFGTAGVIWFDHVEALSVQAERVATDTLRAEVVVAEKVEVREADGTLALILSNKGRMPGVFLRTPGSEGDGRLVTNRPTAGLIFYQEGEEAGGLTYDSNAERGGWIRLTFDQYKGPETVVLRHGGSGPEAQGSGLTITDWLPTEEGISYTYAAGLDSIETLPETSRAEARAALTRRLSARTAERIRLESEERVAGLRLFDFGGRERFRVVVDSLDAAVLQFLDADGEVVRELRGE